MRYPQRCHLDRSGFQKNLLSDEHQEIRVWCQTLKIDILSHINPKARTPEKRTVNEKKNSFWPVWMSPPGATRPWRVRFSIAMASSKKMEKSKPNFKTQHGHGSTKRPWNSSALNGSLFFSMVHPTPLECQYLHRQKRYTYKFTHAPNQSHSFCSHTEIDPFEFFFQRCDFPTHRIG